MPMWALNYRNENDTNIYTFAITFNEIKILTMNSFIVIFKLMLRLPICEI